MRNLPEFVIGFWGAALLGAIVVPLNSWWTGAELGYALENAARRVAFLDDDRLAPRHRARTARRRAARRRAHRPHRRRRDRSPSSSTAPRSPTTRSRASSPTTRSRSSTRRARPGARRVRSAPTAATSTTSGTWRSAAHAKRSSPVARPRPTVSRPPSPRSRCSTSAGIAAIIGSPMGGSKILIMRKWDLERALAARGRRGPHRVRRRARDRPPDHRVPRARGARPRRARRSPWAAPRCRPTCR